MPPDEGGGGAQRPPTVEAAFWIAIVMPLLAVLASVITYFTMRDWVERVLERSIAAQGMNSGDPQFRQALSVAHLVVQASLVGSIVFAVIMAVLWILFGIKMRAGRNWARITLTVFAALWGLSSLIGLISGSVGPGATGVGSLPRGVEVPTHLAVIGYTENGLVLVTMVAFIVLSYVKPSQWFFQASGYPAGGES